MGNPPSIAQNLRFLDHLLVPEGEKLIILKAPKGTGKTQWLSTEVAKAHDLGRRVLIITHRIQLGEALCDRCFRRKFPHLRILRIDSESVADRSRPAMGCIAHLNEILTEYDLVIASPSLETGVSIDIQGHFDGVWGIFQGVQPVNSVVRRSPSRKVTEEGYSWLQSG